MSENCQTIGDLTISRPSHRIPHFEITPDVLLQILSTLATWHLSQAILRKPASSAYGCDNEKQTEQIYRATKFLCKT